MASSVDAKLLKSTKFPSEFNQKVDMQKVNAEVMKKWIASKISDILGNEDDVVIELCFNLIEGSRYPDIKKMQIQLTGFLDKDTPGFCKELWKLCLSAQTNPQGVPKELLEAKKLELIQEKIEAEKSAEEARKRREEEQRREREVNNVRARERGDRRGGRGDTWRGGRGGRGDRDNDGRRGDRDRDRAGGRGFDRRSQRWSRSPPRRRRDSRDRGFRPRASDTYVPSRRNGRYSTSESRSISPARSESRTPPRRRARSPSRNRSPSLRRRSRTPPRRNDSYRGRNSRSRRDRSHERRFRRRSPSESSRSRSPRPSRWRSPSLSISLSPAPRISRARRDTSSTSRSLSSSRSPCRTPLRRLSRGREMAMTSPTPDYNEDRTTRPNSRRGREHREQRLTRGDSRSITPPLRRRSPSRSRSRSRSRNHGGTDRKRRRSIQRYESASKRRRNSSSISAPDARRTRIADDIENDRGSPPPVTKASKPTDADVSSQMKDPKRQASELREKLLKDKIKKMRTLSINST